MTGSSDIIPRSVIYRWLAQFFLYPPTPTDLARYRSHEGQAFLEACRSISALEPISRMLASAIPSRSDELTPPEEICRAFNRAFNVGGPGSVPPYASVYLDGGLLYQKPTRDMNRLLRELCLVLPNETKEPPDHIGIQLHVAAELVDLEMVGQSTPFSRTAFLESHILNWLPALLKRCERMRSCVTVTTFVRGVLDLVVQDVAAGRVTQDDLKELAQITVRNVGISEPGSVSSTLSFKYSRTDIESGSALFAFN